VLVENIEGGLQGSDIQGLSSDLIERATPETFPFNFATLSRPSGAMARMRRL
jgi:hypothetical protein